jgi:stage V sporulation protein R
LLFIRDNNPYLSDWEKDLLTIVHEEACYFLPQIETKIMNEGWASYWHHEILGALRLPQALHLEFLVHHNQVIQPHPGGLNPYHLGFRIWEEIRRRHDEPTKEEEQERSNLPQKSGAEALFEIRESERDISFLRRFLTEKLMRELDLFQFEQKSDEQVITKVSSSEHWREVKETLLRSVGMGSIPVIRVVDADFAGKRSLLLVHEHEGRDLQLEYAEKTLAHVFRLWGREVMLESFLAGKKSLLCYAEGGFSTRTP